MFIWLKGSDPNNKDPSNKDRGIVVLGYLAESRGRFKLALGALDVLG